MPKEIRTARLILRPMDEGDFAFLRTLHADPRVMRYISDGKTRTEEQTREAIARSMDVARADPKLGAWIAHEIAGGAPVGNLILRPPATPGATAGLEIGFSFAFEHWNRGYATEASLAIIDYVRAHLPERRIVALIEPSNEASRRVLTKLGFVAAGSPGYRDPLTGNVLPSDLLELRLRDG
jgi:RimJ/RimL family protein N-acetyltransferase